MSNLSGYDSEAVGFDSVAPIRKPSAAMSTQTTEFEERETESQTNANKDVGCTANTELTAAGYPAGLNEFLKKVVPGVLEQLDQNDREMALSSDSEDGEVTRAVLLHELKVKSTLGGGDHQNSILSISWSGSSNLAVSTGSEQHETWCQGPGQVQTWSLKGSNKKIQVQDMEERECATVVCYHPTVVALLAYGTVSGELVVRQGCAEALNVAGGSARVTCLRWAESALANLYLTMLVRSRGVRRCASDQVLFSSGSDGAVNVWRVNWDLRTFENIVRYELNSGSRPRPDITCFDLPKSHPLTAFGEHAPEVFVVGTKYGDMLMCATSDQLDAASDPVRERLEGHRTCVLDVAFSRQRAGVFVSISTDSELRMYRVGQPSPLKTFCLDVAVSCMSWLGNGPCVVLGLAEAGKEALRVYNATTGKVVPLEGLSGDGGVTCVDVCHSGCYRIAAGGADNTVRIWELPAFRDKFIWDAYDI